MKRSHCRSGQLLVKNAMADGEIDVQTFVNTIRSALNSVNPQVPFVDSSPSNQIQATDPYTKRYSPLEPPTHHFT